MITRQHFKSIAACALLLGFASLAQAAPINLTATLTGDGRPGNPDGLNILVTITGDTNSNQATFVVDLDMAAAHPSAALHEFYFNMAGVSTDYVFGSFLPNNWSLTDTNVTNAQGSGNADFMFEISDNTHNVTNAVNLSFVITRIAGNFTAAHFLTALQGCSNDLALGCGRLGAHIGSLVAGRQESDSGFALGDFNQTPTAQAPEPATLALTGIGLFAASRSIRRKKA